MLHCLRGMDAPGPNDTEITKTGGVAILFYPVWPVVHYLDSRN